MLARRAPSIASDERRLLQVRLDRGPSGGVEALEQHVTPFDFRPR
jgi:hypothetical protein